MMHAAPAGVKAYQQHFMCTILSLSIWAFSFSWANDHFSFSQYCSKSSDHCKTKDTQQFVSISINSNEIDIL